MNVVLLGSRRALAEVRTTEMMIQNWGDSVKCWLTTTPIGGDIPLRLSVAMSEIVDADVVVICPSAGYDSILLAGAAVFLNKAVLEIRRGRTRFDGFRNATCKVKGDEGVVLRLAELRAMRPKEVSDE